MADRELRVDDFTFAGTLGSDGASLERVGRNHFMVTLGHAPEHPEWTNMLQFRILQGARGNDLRLDVHFHGGDVMRFNDYTSSWSYDGATWQPLRWQDPKRGGVEGDTLVFPTFEQDTVWFGHQVPMSFEDAQRLIDGWRDSPFVEVHVVGQSLEGRDITRLVITDPDSPLPVPQRWAHHFANQHPGEHNSQWRMAGMIDWLLSDDPAAAEMRRSNVCHFMLMMCPDGPSHGWYRVNGQGVDMNRTYRVEGAHPDLQAHEAYLGQKDFEALMQSDCPPTTTWSMHTWGGIVEPLLRRGPEMDTVLGPWTDLRDAIERNDPDKLVKPLALRETPIDGTGFWTAGPHLHFGLSAILCEGAGGIVTKAENVASGLPIIKGLGEYYRGPRRTA